MFPASTNFLNFSNNIPYVSTCHLRSQGQIYGGRWGRSHPPPPNRRMPGPTLNKNFSIGLIHLAGGHCTSGILSWVTATRARIESPLIDPGQAGRLKAQKVKSDHVVDWTTFDACFAHVSFFYFFPTHFFRRLQTDIFETST